jgi:hypothetical protein
VSVKATGARVKRPRKPLGFKQRDITRAIKALSAGGVKNGKVEIKPDGTITLIIGDAAILAADDDSEIEAFIARHG